MDINERSRQTKGYKPFMVFYNIAMGLFYIAGGVFFIVQRNELPILNPTLLGVLGLAMLLYAGVRFYRGYSEYRQKNEN